MKLYERIEVDVEKGVAIKHYYIVGCALLQGKKHAAAGAEGCCLTSVGERYAVVVVTEIVFYFFVHVACGEHYVGELLACKSVEDMAKERASAYGCHGFGHIADDVGKTGAESAGKDYGFARLHGCCF